MFDGFDYNLDQKNVLQIELGEESHTVSPTRIQMKLSRQLSLSECNDKKRDSRESLIEPIN